LPVLVQVTGWIGVAAGAAVTLARAVGGDQHTPLIELAVLVPLTAVVLACYVPLAATARAWRLAAVGAVLLAVQVAWLLPAFGVGVRTPQRLAGATELRVLEFNALTGLADPEAIMATVRGRRIDVFAVEELTPQLVHGLRDAGLLAELPYHSGAPNWASSGTAIYSRRPLIDLGSIEGTTFLMPRAALRLPDGTTLTVTAVHALSPLPGRVHAWRWDLSQVAATVAATAGPQLVLGDFNATRDHAGFRKLLEGPLGLTDSAEAVGLLGGAWPGFTWPADQGWLPPFMRLDHVLVTPASIGVRGLDVVPLPGSDHRALVITLAVLPGQATR
jgi:endonuclease/exonuclease/phosphatase (EEP) superfamily protein YafD